MQLTNLELDISLSVVNTPRNQNMVPRDMVEQDMVGADDGEPVVTKVNEPSEGGVYEVADGTDVGDSARAFARMGDIFTSIGDIVDTGYDWLCECRNWNKKQSPDGHQDGRHEEEFDPKDLSNYDDE